MSVISVRREMQQVWSGMAPRPDVDLGDDLGSTLARMRLKRGLSQPQLASRAMVDHSYISRIESGQRFPSYEVVEAIAAALKLTPDERNALLAKAGFLPDDPTSLVDPLAAQVHAVLVRIAGTPMDARVRTAIEVVLAGARGAE